MRTHIINERKVSVDGEVTFEEKEIPFTDEENSEREADETEALQEYDALPYAVKRQGEYPPITDQLDAIWKELDYRRLKGDALTQEADDMLDEILAVKQKYPKTQGGD